MPNDHFINNSVTELTSVSHISVEETNKLFHLYSNTMLYDTNKLFGFLLYMIRTYDFFMCWGSHL